MRVVVRKANNSKRIAALIKTKDGYRIILSKPIVNIHRSRKSKAPQTEDQLLKRIDRSLAQADAGMCIDADEVINEMLAECD